MSRIIVPHRKVGRLGVLAAVLAILAIAPAAASASPAPVPCHSIGAGKYNCYFYPPGNGFSAGTSVVTEGGTRVGYLNGGDNYVFCQTPGTTLTSGRYKNNWWAYTIADDDKYGWVNALYGRGGDNYGKFAHVPSCDNSRVGYPPGGRPAPPKPKPKPPAPPPSKPPAQSPKPASCSNLGSGRYSCDWYPAGDGTSGGTPVITSGGHVVGYLNVGSNWIICQQAGGETHYGHYYNKWYGWTEADDGSYGWASAVFASGGDNDGKFALAPSCGGAHGNAPSHSPGPVTGGGSGSGGGGGGGGGTHGGGSSSCPDATGPGDNVTRWNPVVICVLKKLGVYTSDNVDAVDIVIAHESSGDPGAINLSDSNAAAGHPSEGLVQTIQGTFDTYRCSGLPDNIWDPAANICAGMNYGIHRYGSIANIPGVVRVREGLTYVGYFAHAKPEGIASGCGIVKRGRHERMAVRSHRFRCSRARTVAKIVEGSKLFRHAIHHRKRSYRSLRVRTRFGRFACQLDRGKALGRFSHVVACTQRRERVSWTAVR
jgi:hypothetical protein